MTERDWVAATVWGEARGESLAGKLAVARVIRNRVKTGRWGHTYESVCCAPKQFSCWNATDPNLVSLKALIVQIDNGAPLGPVVDLCYAVADVVMSEQDVKLAGATHYFAAALPQPPAWAKTGTFVGAVGNHLFFSGVS